ncbi:MAG: AI-2E family transporter [bacterium]|nr:AI-2E family transporter [bacterium]
MGTSKQIIEIGSGTILRVILFLLLLAFLYFIRNILAIAIFSVVIASAVEPAAAWFAQRKIPRVIGVLITYIAAFIVLTAAFSLVVPPLFSQFSSLATDIPAFIENVTEPTVLAEYFPSLPSSIGNLLGSIGQDLSQAISGLSGDFFQTASGVFGGALSLFIIIVLSFYLSVQENGIESFLRVVTPLHYEEYVLSVWRRSKRKIGRWMRGQILLGVLVGVMSFLGLAILQVDFALSLAILAGVFELIPMFGATLAAIPAVILAFLQEPILGLLVLALYIIIQQIENNLIYPIVMRKAIGVHPALVILSMIIGAQMGGVAGVLLAVPIVVVLVEISNDIIAEKHTT